MNKPTLKRSLVIPLHLPEDIYRVLSSLEIGAPVPPQIYICDYKDGTIPPWTVAEIQERGGAYRILTVVDPTSEQQTTLLDPVRMVAVDVFTLPTKTLRGPFWTWFEGCPADAHVRNPLADCRQHARQIVDRAGKAERECVA